MLDLQALRPQLIAGLDVLGLISRGDDDPCPRLGQVAHHGPPQSTAAARHQDGLVRQ